jgi:hypothetical protein
MIGALRLAAGFLVTTSLVAGAAAVSTWPPHRTIPPGTGVVKLSISHGGQRTCRSMTEAELSKLPRNMRRQEVCERSRQPVHLELDIDGRTVFARTVPPSGIAGDSPSRVYERFELPAGGHTLAVRMRDGTQPGFAWSAERSLTLAPAQNLAIDFREDAGGFIFH